MFYRVALSIFAMSIAIGCGHSIDRVHPSSPIASIPVQVGEFDTRTAKVESYDASTQTFGLEIAQKIAAALEEAGMSAHATPGGAAHQGYARVEGRVTEIHGGSRAMRYLVGFGAGSTRFAVSGRVVGPDGRVLGTFSDARHSGFGFFGGDTETLMHRCVEAVGYDVARMISTGRYAMND